MRAATLIFPVIWLSCTAVHAIITQQDPSALGLGGVDPRNHYYLPESVQTPEKRPSWNSSSVQPNGTSVYQNSTSVHRRGPANAARAVPEPTSSTGALLCGPGSPCIDGSCCGKTNICGFGPEYCGFGCQSGCGAKSNCGRNSDGGQVKCGMNLCCSFYGWCGATSEYCATRNNGCQQGFGSCETHAPFQCDAGAASATKRTIGYYQGANVYAPGRKCGAVGPEDIKTDKYTHLYWAFAEFNPTTFEIIPADLRDTALYKDFTSLNAAGKVQTWISIGGFDFTTNNTRAWTDMVGSADHRQTFIRSLVNFMKVHGFQGVDMDWEYPVDAGRGGHANDMANLVQLLADMRANSDFGHNFGISVTLAPDLWYLQHYDAKGLLANADWLGFMSYDLHGTWDEKVPEIGKVVYGQADIHDIERDLTPLWFDLTPTDMSKLNFGLALYGRGYTLANPSCNRGDGACGWTDASKQGPCTTSPGVLSLFEIKDVIKNKGLTPVALNDGKVDSMMKQITWDDQWIGYDDEETLLAKINFASSRCFGGTMSWSVDLEVRGNSSGGNPFRGRKGVQGDWQTVQCTAPYVNDAKAYPRDRWTAADATDAWDAAGADAYNSLITGTAGGLSFPELISNFFHGPDGMNCEDVDARSGCVTSAQCMAPAAGFLIINSMGAISNLNYNTWAGIESALTHVNAAIGSFSSTFAPIKDKYQQLKILLDVLGLGFALTVSPLWNAAFKELKFFQGKNGANLLGTIKDWVNPIVSNGITLIKDGSLSSAALNAQDNLSTSAGQIVQTWQYAINQSNFDLFNGSSSSIALLGQQIQNGQVLEADFNVNLPDVQTSVQKAIFGALIPQAWAYSNEDIHPFVLNSGAKCGTKYPVSTDYLEHNAADASWSCIDNTIYYLLYVSGAPYSCIYNPQFGPPVCTFAKFAPPPGTDSFNGKNWGGLVTDDFSFGAVNTFKANGNKNGGNMIDLDNSDSISDIGDNGIRAAGVIRIPICTNPKQTYLNWQEQNTKLKNYPCSD